MTQQEQAQHPHSPEVPQFSIEEAMEYVAKNRYLLPTKKFAQLSKGCVDDRESRTQGELPDIAIPGAGAGILITLLASLEKLSSQGTLKYVPDFRLVFSRIEESVGKITYHTDEKNMHDAVSCAGCGHAYGAISNPELYGLSETYATFLKSYINDLRSYQNPPVVYKGGHRASAIIIIADETTGLPATDGVHQVYRYHKTLHEKGLREIADMIYPLFDEPSFSREQYGDVLCEIASKQLDATLAVLGVGKNIFAIENDKLIPVKVQQEG